MRILINSLNYHPELTGVGKYSGEMAEWLSKKGHDVRVIAAPPYYPGWSVDKPYSAYQYRKEIVNGVSVWRCPLYVPSNPTGLKRIIHLASFSISSLPVVAMQMFWRPDVVVTIEPPLSSAPVIWLFSHIFKPKCWLHIQDFEIDAAFDLGILSSKWMRSLVLSVERWLIRKFDVVSTISSQMIDRLDQKGVLKSKQVFFPNWVDIDNIHPSEDVCSYRKELGIKSAQIVALYSGNMGQKQGLEIIVEAAYALRKNSDIVFVMCGGGASLSRIQEMAKGLANIIWLPLQPIERLNDLLNLADIHLLPQRQDAEDLVMPSKLTGMLASGKPILATVNKGTQIALVLEDSGVIVPPGDVSKFASELIRLSSNKVLRSELGEKARSYAVKNLSTQVILSAFNDSLCDLCKK